MTAGLLTNRIKQYGYGYVVIWLFRKLLKPIYSVEKYFILIIDNHIPGKVSSDIKRLTPEYVAECLHRGYISNDDERRFIGFLSEGSDGYYIEQNGELAAWGFVQNKGFYNYGRYSFEIPSDVYVLKNLYVRPSFRGRSLGKKINVARINSIPKSGKPCVFVIPENRYAIRNLKMYGFIDSIKVEYKTYFSKHMQRKIVEIESGEWTKSIVKGLIVENTK